MGSIESQLSQVGIVSNRRDAAHKDEHWRVTNIELFDRTITINKVKYTFGKHELGSGAFGTVYPARRNTDSSNVAIKVVSLVESSSRIGYLVDSFLNEVNQSTKLSSQSNHVVKMFDFDFNPSGLAFIVMERGDQDLEKALIKKPTLPIYQQKFLWRQILNILRTLHKHSIVHLDLKPSNLVFFGNRLKLVDLGIAQKANSRGKGPTGTFGFSAPEVYNVPHDAHAHYTHKADIWSVGAILYWINYGGGPKYDQKNKSYHPPSGIPAAKDRHVVDILRHTLDMDPRRRPETKWLAQHAFLN